MARKQTSSMLGLPQPPRGAGRGIFLSSDDHNLAKQIEQLHNPDGRSVNVRPLFHLVEDIINRATQPVGLPLLTLSQRETMEGKSSVQGLEEVPDSPLIIERISSEIISKLLGGTDAHSITLSVLHLLEHFTWEAKVVLALAAFSLTYGDFWLLVQIYAINPLAKSMAVIKRLPMVVEHTASFKPQFDAINNLIREMLQVGRCIVEFAELPTIYLTSQDTEVKAALTHFPVAVYWIVRSTVSAASQISTLSTMRFEYVTATSQSWELSNWSHKLKTINDHLRRTLTNLYQLIDEKREDEAYNMIKNIIYKTLHIDNMKVLKVLIHANDDVPPIYDCSAKRRVHLDVLRRKNVLLLISGLDITHDELYILEQSYTESKIHAYDIVWIPVIDGTKEWTNAMQVQFEALQASMPWYSVHHPSIIEKVVIKFFRNDWHFNGKPILVVLDPQGKVVNQDAMHMMWIWQSIAFPFTSEREESLWETESWRLELLVDGIDATISDWIREGKYMFLYGGDDIEWIRKFTTEARAVAQAHHIPLEMVYVGRSHNKELVRKVCAAIKVEKLSSYWQDPTMVWFFWTRLESMISSKFQMAKVDHHGDVIFQEIQRLHSYDKGHVGWALLAKGSTIVVTGHGPIALTTLIEQTQWKDLALKQGFDVAFKAYYTKLHVREYPCHRVQFPFGGRVPHIMVCPDCRRLMQKHTTFVCCHEDVVPQENPLPPVVYEA